MSVQMYLTGDQLVAGEEFCHRKAGNRPKARSAGHSHATATEYVKSRLFEDEVAPGRFEIRL